MREWSARVGYLGCSSPANPTKKQKWQPPFTVLPHVVTNPKDLCRLIRGLQYHGWSYETDPLWNPIRDYSPEEKIQYGVCSIGSTKSKNLVTIGVNTGESCVGMNSQSMSVKRQLDITSDSQSSSATSHDASKTDDMINKPQSYVSQHHMSYEYWIAMNHWLIRVRCCISVTTILWCDCELLWIFGGVEIRTSPTSVDWQWWQSDIRNQIIKRSGQSIHTYCCIDHRSYCLWERKHHLWWW